jgi:hypothetical protein
MKKYVAVIFIIALFSSCCKWEKGACTEYKGYHKFIYEPIVISEDCNCIVAGKVKYLKDCKTVALIHYGDGECDNIATKIICENGDCYGKDNEPLESYEFTIKCNGNTINEGIVEADELELLFDLNAGPQP